MAVRCLASSTASEESETDLTYGPSGEPGRTGILAPMASLSASSSLTEVKAAYDDNLDYDLVGSVEKAKNFIQAARMLLRRMAEEVAHGDDYRKIAAELDKAENWWRASDATAAAAAIGAVRHFSLEQFRS